MSKEKELKRNCPFSFAAPSYETMPCCDICKWYTEDVDGKGWCELILTLRQISFNLARLADAFELETVKPGELD